MKKLNKQVKILIKSFLILSILICSSCKLARIKIKNQEWCGDKGKHGAVCFNTLSNTKKVIKKEEWDEIKVSENSRFGKLCTSTKTFADIKANIIKICKVTKRCSYEVENKVVKFYDNIEELKKKSEEVVKK